MTSRRGFVKAAAAALCSTRLARGATLLRQPYLQNVLADRASILWTMDTAVGAAVTVSSPRGGSVTVPASVQAFEASQTGLSAAFYQYRADITGLLPAHPYRYSVAAGDQAIVAESADHTFHTAPQGEFSFLAFGDSGSGSDDQVKLVALMEAEPNISMVTHLGDLAYPDGSFQQFEDTYYRVNAPLMRRLPFFSTPGNHEYNTDSAAPYLAGMVAPNSSVPSEDQGRYYSFDWGCAHFTSVDSNLLVTSSAARMLAWLDADLAATKQPWRIVFLHHTPHPTGFHVGDPVCDAVRTQVSPVIERHGVQLVLAGHEHAYERSYPLAANRPAQLGQPSTMYVVSGGGGGALEAAGTSSVCALSIQVFHYLRIDVKDTLTLTAVGVDGEVIDRITLGPVQGPLIENVLSRGGSRRIAPGSLVSISGRNLADRVRLRQGSLAGVGDVTVKAGSETARLYAEAPTQIDAQIPYGISGQTELAVVTPWGPVAQEIAVEPAAPSLISINAGGIPFSGYNPARPGERVSLYVTGLGAVSQAAGANLRPVAPVEIALGDQRLKPVSIRPTDPSAAIFQVDLDIPADTDDGIYALSVHAGATASDPVNLDVLARGIAFRRNRARTQVRGRSRKSY